MNSRIVPAGLLALVLAACSSADERQAQSARPQIASNAPATGTLAPAQAVAADRSRLLPDFTSLVEKQGPAVVNVIATGAVIKRPRLPHDPFFDFFRRFLPAPPGPDGLGGPRFRSQGQGSGFIISSDGYILTNAHLVAGAREVTVRLADASREFKAKVIGADHRTDVALLKVHAANLPAVTLGSSSELQVGDWVAAIGSPFGFDNTITAGIVSAKGRNFPSESFVPFIQTDVAINSGNSGGPLLNLKGEVVGINSMIYTRTGGYMGVSFAIPIELAMDVGNQLRTTGKVRRGRLGVTIQPVTPDLAKAFQLQDKTGALVAGVERGSPADEAGLQPGDIIVKYNGKTIGEATELPRLVAGTKPGSAASLEVLRRGERRLLTVTVGEFPAETASAQEPGRGTSPANRLGLVLRELFSAERKGLGVENGLMVVSVEEPAADSPIRRGDLIIAIGNTDVTSVNQFNHIVEQHKPGSSVALLVRRGQDVMYIAVEVEQS